MPESKFELPQLVINDLKYLIQWANPSSAKERTETFLDEQVVPAPPPPWKPTHEQIEALWSADRDGTRSAEAATRALVEMHRVGWNLVQRDWICARCAGLTREPRREKQ